MVLLEYFLMMLQIFMQNLVLLNNHLAWAKRLENVLSKTNNETTWKLRRIENVEIGE